MHFFRQPQKLGFFLCLIVVSVFLRSFIAPGYMLQVSGEDGLGIIFCDGPVSLYISQDDHTTHTYHDNDHNNDAQSEIHISPICGQWSTSSVLVFNTTIESLQIYVNQTEPINLYATPYYKEYSDTVCSIRGPPSYI